MNSKHLSRGSRMPSPVPKGKVRIYNNRFCPYSQRVILVLDAKRIPYEVVNINLIRKPYWIHDKVPMGKVPALELESGEVLNDSIIICDYLDEKYTARQLHPKDPLQKAKDQLLLREFSRIMNSLLRTLYRTSTSDDNIIEDGLSAFERELTNRGGPFFGGHKPGMLDYMIWPWCERTDVLKMYGRDTILKANKYKRLMEWRKTMCEEEVVKKSAIDGNIHVKYIQSLATGSPDYDSLLLESR